MAIKEIRPGSVAVLMPCGGPVEPRVLQSLGNVISYSWLKGHQVRQVGVTDRTLVDDARNWLAKEFLETECEWSFWMDSDMILEPRTIDVLLRRANTLEAKMTSGIYYQRGGNHIPVIGKQCVESKDGKFLRKTEDPYFNHFVYPSGIGGHPFKIDVAGFGVCLIHRDVFEKLEYPYFKFLEFKYIKGDEKGGRRRVSEDFYFFVQAKEAGFQLWAVPELDCGHIGQAPIIRHKDMVINKETMVERADDHETQKETAQ